MFAMSRISNGCYSPEHEGGDEQRVVASSLVSLNRRKQRAKDITHHRLRVQYPLAKIPSALRIGWMPLLWSRKKLTPGYLPFTSETGNSSWKIKCFAPFRWKFQKIRAVIRSGAIFLLLLVCLADLNIMYFVAGRSPDKNFTVLCLCTWFLPG